MLDEEADLGSNLDGKKVFKFSAIISSQAESPPDVKVFQQHPYNREYNTETPLVL